MQFEGIEVSGIERVVFKKHKLCDKCRRKYARKQPRNIHPCENCKTKTTVWDRLFTTNDGCTCDSCDNEHAECENREKSDVFVDEMTERVVDGKDMIALLKKLQYKKKKYALWSHNETLNVKTIVRRKG
jgi:transcription initiation factor IIE alpha subunit